MLVFLWTVAIVGLLLTVILIDQMPEWFILSIFFAMGWSALSSMAKAWMMYGFKNISFAIYGGIAYSLGAMIDFLHIGEIVPGLVGSHEVFHIFVIIGASLHWLLIYRWADQPTHNRLVFMVKERNENDLSAKAIGESFVIHATSRKELRIRVKEVLNTRIHPRLIPQKVRFRFYKDVVMNMPA
jgi:hypothetical protein